MKAFHNLNDSKKPAKIAVVISKKAVSKAVQRNLWRRRTKAISKEFLNKLSGFEIVINLNGAINTADFNELKEDLTKCFENLRSS